MRAEAPQKGQRNIIKSPSKKLHVYITTYHHSSCSLLSPPRLSFCPVTLHVIHFISPVRLYRRRARISSNQKPVTPKSAPDGAHVYYIFHFLSVLPQTPVAWAVPPSPARGKRFCFRARTDPASDLASAGRKGQKIGQKNCAKLCTIVQRHKPGRTAKNSQKIACNATGVIHTEKYLRAAFHTSDPRSWPASVFTRHQNIIQFFRFTKG